MQKRVVLGTAGHIDHGKTSLVRALTGIDTDRLKEEKERGITIELGFAHMELPSGVRLAIVDVPGHERFVKNMVAGASGIDVVMMVVAADEGVMPQTREHMEICSLLGVAAGLVALTKIDMVDPELLELAREDVAAAIQGTFLEDAPIIPVSAVSGAGVETLQAGLDELARQVPQRSSKGAFRLPVDRVFTMRGFGTVVTGTLISGAVSKDDEVVFLPGTTRGKVRGIQVHGAATGKAYAGQRAALNLTGVDVDQVHRGDTAVRPGSLPTTYMVDARLQVLASCARPIANRARVRLHVGTQEIPVIVALLDRDELRPGDWAYVQLRSAEHMVTCPGDRFVVRAYSPAVTIGGGRILDHRPPKHRGRKPEVLQQLEVLDDGDVAARVAVFVAARGAAGMDPQEAEAALGVPLEEARNLLQGAVRSGAAVVTERRTQRHHDAALVEALKEQAVELLHTFHERNPLRKGLGLEELRTKLPSYLGPKLVEFVIQDLAQAGRVVLEGDAVRAADFVVQLSTDDESVRSSILEFLDRRGFEGPAVEEVAQAVGAQPESLRPVMDYLVGQGTVTRTKEGFFFLTERLDELARQVIEVLRKQPEIGVAEIKEITGTTRKYTIPLLEYLDTQRITARRGDVRVLGAKGRG